jgi:hypothetical protein
MIEDCQEVLEDVKTNDENLEKPTAEAIAKGLFIQAAAGEFLKKKKYSSGVKNL